MMQLPRILVVFFLSAFVALSATAAPTSTPALKTTPGEKPTAGVELSNAITKITGVAISPLLGVAALGAYQDWKAETPEQKAALPWYAQWQYYTLGLLLVGAVAFKDAAGAALPPGMKKPLDVLETMESKVSGLVAAGAVIPLSFNSLSSLITSASVDSSIHTGLAMIGFGAFDTSTVLNIVMMPFAIAMFAVVWITAHAINVLILLSPWGAIDAALKAFRTSVLGLLVVTSHINPWVGAALSLVIIVLAYFLAGWAFRLSLYGSVFCWDFLTRRRYRFTPDAKENWVFSARGLSGAPIRSYGKLSRGSDGNLVFSFRPWLFLGQKHITLTETQLAVGRGAFHPTIVSINGDDERTILLLPPRYKGHEQTFGKIYAIHGQVDVGLRRAWSALKELLGFSTKRSPAAADAA